MTKSGKSTIKLEKKQPLSSKIKTSIFWDSYNIILFDEVEEGKINVTLMGRLKNEISERPHWKKKCCSIRIIHGGKNQIKQIS